MNEVGINLRIRICDPPIAKPGGRPNVEDLKNESWSIAGGGRRIVTFVPTTTSSGSHHSGVLTAVSGTHNHLLTHPTHICTAVLRQSPIRSAQNLPRGQFKTSLIIIIIISLRPRYLVSLHKYSATNPRVPKHVISRPQTCMYISEAPRAGAR
ncbi:hypothetical protein K458DRAFT_435416 [Lentithecium fluviatile CBS 122367]|uniref:Uncharacterized protein n=1 Tax=Lentithecium fluviatile CBS 122367 TaxID=1168545 RepID=A0A6G1IM56_9PLEO|nr:hypothetical protein K458DRAFT_435416 [Lentithecium fluviatile CBS 122367]